MSIERIESFQHYATAELDEKGWTNVSAAIVASVGPRGDACLKQTNDNQGVTIGLPSSAASRTIGFRYKRSNHPSAARVILKVMETATTHIGLGIDTTGHLVAFRATIGTVLATGATVLATDTWYYIEFSWTIANTGGRAKVMLNTSTTEIDFTGDTQNGGTATSNTLEFGQGATSTADSFWADFYMESVFDTFAGDHGVDAFYPHAEGNSSDFTPLSGTDNALMVDENPADGDTSYNESATVGHKDTHQMGNIPGDSTSVKAVQTVIQARKTDVGARGGRIVVRSDGADYEGADIALADGYSMYRNLRLVDPDTAAAWTVAAVNALEAGYKVES